MLPFILRLQGAPIKRLQRIRGKMRGFPTLLVRTILAWRGLLAQVRIATVLEPFKGFPLLWYRPVWWSLYNAGLADDDQPCLRRNERLPLA